MKKILCILLVLAAVVCCFSSCIKSEEARAVEEKISAIGEVSLDKEILIIEAEEAYSQLSEKDKTAVSAGELELKRTQLDSLKAFSAEAQNVLALFEKSLTEYGVAKSEITEGYNTLLNKLSSCEEVLKAEYEKIFEPVRIKNQEYEKITEEAAASAKAYINYFRGINTDKTITVTDIGCIAQISDGITYYLFAFTYTDGEKEKTLYSTVRFAGTPAKESFKAYKDNFYSDAPSSEKADALTMGNIEILPSAVN